MTIAEMKDALKARLEDKADKQDKTAIDTTAEDVSRETSAGTEKSIIDNSEVADETTSAKDFATSIIEDVQELQSMVELKPEKMVLFEAVLANLKEIKKLIK
jgi:hypothetical protein